MSGSRAKPHRSLTNRCMICNKPEKCFPYLNLQPRADSFGAGAAESSRSGFLDACASLRMHARVGRFHTLSTRMLAMIFDAIPHFFKPRVFLKQQLRRPVLGADGP